jgi:small subunit ribosomal protein S1
MPVKVLSTLDFGVFVRIREGVEGFIATNELVLKTNEAGEAIEIKIGDEFDAEVANLDTQDRRVTLTMRIGEASAEGASRPREPKAAKAPGAGVAKKAKEGGDAAGGTIGDLIKQKLGNLAVEKDK